MKGGIRETPGPFETVLGIRYSSAVKLAWLAITTPSVTFANADLSLKEFLFRYVLLFFFFASFKRSSCRKHIEPCNAMRFQFVLVPLQVYRTGMDKSLNVHKKNFINNSKFRIICHPDSEAQAKYWHKENVYSSRLPTLRGSCTL